MIDDWPEYDDDWPEYDDDWPNMMLLENFMWGFLK